MSAYAVQQRRTLIFVVVFFVLLTATIGAVGYTSYRNFETQTRAETERWLSVASETKADAVSVWHNDLMDYAALIRENQTLASAAASLLKDPQNAETSALLRDDLNNYKKRDEVSAIELLDPRGSRLISIPSETTALALPAVEKIPQAIATDQIILADFYRDAASGDIYLSILVPISNGVIALRIDPQTRLYPLLAKKMTDTPSLQTYLARGEASDALFLSPLPYDPNSPLNLRVSLQEKDSLEAMAVKGKMGIIEGTDYRGVAMLADARPAPEGWTLVTQTSIVKMRDTITVYFGRTVVVTGTIVFYTGLGLALVWRQQLLKRYQHETKAAQQRADELDGKVRERTAELSALSRQMADMHEKQIRDLARELHDGVGQNLTAINLNLSLLRETLPADEAETSKPILANTSHLVEETVARMRNVMADFLPPMLEHYGLTSALNWYAEQFAQRANLQIHVNDVRSDQARLDPKEEVGLFRITQEALNNIAKHARASQAEIELSDEDDTMQLTIRDDGVGFDPQAIRPDATHWGFAIMRERARALGATIEITSAPNDGTQITLRMPRKQ
ncbi:MAG: sensor histidine kinase [Chloroflexi bacterium]|nr:sensor histidine kinase [Chloroflexota bacterium]